MSKAQIELLKKYLISTLLSGAVFALFSWLFPGRKDLIPAQRYIIPIAISGAVIFFFYFKGFSGFKRKENWTQGGKFYVIILYVLGIIMTPALCVKMVDEATQTVAEVTTADQISDNTPEYVYVRKFMTSPDRYTYSWKYWTGERNRETRTNTLEYTAYLPIILAPEDTVYKIWIVLKQRTEKDGNLTESELKQFEDNFIEESNIKTEHFDFKSIVFFSREKVLYNTIPTKGNASFKGNVLLLKPSFESLSYEFHSDLIQYSIMYGIIFVFFLCTVASIDIPKPKSDEPPQVKSPYQNSFETEK